VTFVLMILSSYNSNSTFKVRKCNKYIAISDLCITSCIGNRLTFFYQNDSNMLFSTFRVKDVDNSENNSENNITQNNTSKRVEHVYKLIIRDWMHIGFTL